MKKLILTVAALALSAGMGMAASHGKTIRLGTEGAYPPYNYIDDKGEIAGFERDLEGELAKLRRAISLLDRAFPGREEPLLPAEPSFADLVSDTAQARAR